MLAETTNQQILLAIIDSFVFFFLFFIFYHLYILFNLSKENLEHIDKKYDEKIFYHFFIKNTFKFLNNIAKHK